MPSCPNDPPSGGRVVADDFDPRGGSEIGGLSHVWDPGGDDRVLW